MSSGTTRRIWLHTWTCVAKSILIAVTSLVGLKLYLHLTKGIYRGTRQMQRKTVIITGGNAGIGKEAARELARRGARVILACRNLDKGLRAAKEIYADVGRTVTVKRLDLCSLESVRQFADDVLNTEERLDVLVNNAGIFPDRIQLTGDGYEECLQANYLGHFLLTLSLIELLKKSAPSRVINLSSLLHHFGTVHRLQEQARGTYRWLTPTLAYCNSKMAMLSFTMRLARKLKPYNVTVNAVHPGVVNTDLANRESLVTFVIRLFYSTIGKTPWEGAQTVVYAAVDDRFTLDTGKYLADCAVAWPNRRALNAREARQAFEESAKLVGLKLDDVNKLF